MLREGEKCSQVASDVLAQGGSLRKAVAAVIAAGGQTSLTNMQRHKRHVVLATPPDVEEVAATKATNIEILEEIIQKGFGNRRNWKPTIGDTMKALDMHFRLTQNSPFDELLNTLADAAIQEENPDATGEREATDESEGP